MAKNPQSFACLDIFEHPLLLSGMRETVTDALMKANDQFFDAFEDGLMISVVGSDDPYKDGKYQCQVHFYVSNCDNERRAMYKGWVYGFITANGVTWASG